jgi:hypothetical protein
MFIAVQLELPWMAHRSRSYKGDAGCKIQDARRHTKSDKSPCILHPGSCILKFGNYET